MNTQNEPKNDAGTQVSASEKAQGSAPVSTAKLSLGGTSAAGADDIEKLRLDLQRHKVEEGRVKALSNQLQEREAELERIRRENEELKNATRKSAVDFLDPELRDRVDEDILSASDKMIRGSHDSLLSEIDKRVAPIQQTLEQERMSRIKAEQVAMDMRIDQLHPGFAAETNKGGKYSDKWEAFLDETDPATGLKNGVILSGAYNGGRVGGVTQMINSFMGYAGISRSESMKENAFPGANANYVEPPVRAGDKPIYSLAEYNKMLADSREAYSSGRQTAKERQALLSKLTDAAREGRVVVNGRPQVGV